MPGIKVSCIESYDAKGLMIQAIRDDNPVMFMYHKGSWPARGWRISGQQQRVPRRLDHPFGQAKSS